MDNLTPKQVSKSTSPSGARPHATSIKVDGVPSELKAMHQWVLWRYVLKDGRWTKEPFQPSGYHAKSNDPSTWSTFDTVLAAYRAGDFDGIGLCFGGEVVGVDLDTCFNADRTLKPWADNLLCDDGGLAIPTYTEISPSGDGLHLIYFGALHPQLIGKSFDLAKHTGIAFYCYPSSRYFTVTGRQWGSVTTVVMIEPVDLAPVLDYCREVFPKKKPRETTVCSSANLRTPERADDDVIRIAANARNGRKFLALMQGSVVGYPSQSEADAALCAMLAHYTKDTTQIDRIFKRSGLYRDKWDARHYETGATYGGATIEKAVTGKWGAA